MKNLSKLSNEEICEFLLNGKKGDCLELNPERSELNKTDFTERVIYKDKNVEIVFSFLEIAKDDMIQQFFIRSNWWGKIKNSFFTLEGFKGKSKERCGVINVDELKNFNVNGDYVPVNNRNEQAKIEIIDFASLTLLCQRRFKASPSYQVVEIISEAPNSLVRIEVKMPDGKTHLSEGTSKKDAANRFANSYSF